MSIPLALCLQVAGLPALEVLPPERAHPAPMDWLGAPAPWPAGAFRNEAGTRVYLDNGLLRRTFLVSGQGEQGLTTLALDDLAWGGKSWLRDVSPEVVLEIDGVRREVGGADSPPGGAFIDTSWLRAINAGERPLRRAEDRAFRLVSIQTGPIGDAGITWVPGEFRHCAPGATWPPKGIELTLEFEPEGDARSSAVVRVHHALFDGLPAYAKGPRRNNFPVSGACRRG